MICIFTAIYEYLACGKLSIIANLEDGDVPD